LSEQVKYYAHLGMVAEDNPDLPLSLTAGILHAQEELRAGLGRPYQWGVIETNPKPLPQTEIDSPVDVLSQLLRDVPHEWSDRFKSILHDFHGAVSEIEQRHGHARLEEVAALLFLMLREALGQAGHQDAPRPAERHTSQDSKY